MKEPAVGIDLGTTFSAVAALGPSGRPEIVPNAEGDRITASAVYFETDGPVIVGQDAVDAAGGYPDRVVRWVKSEMGDPAWRFGVDGRAYSAVDISAIILKKLKNDASLMLGPVKRAVVTVPAYFDETRRRATIEAAEQAGLEVLRIINEPTAAALAYASGSHITGRVLIYDFGGGTFDVSIADIHSAHQINIIASEGDHQLGGYHLDQSLVEHLSRQFEEEHGVSLLSEEEQGVKHHTSNAAEKAKRNLSRRESVSGIALLRGGHSHSASISRNEFEQIISQHITRTEMLVEDALDQAGMKASELDAVILAGGSTRIPCVREMLKKKTGLVPVVAINPDEAVALGAAIQAGILMQEQGLLDISAPAAESLAKTRLRDVANHSYGTLSIGEAYGGNRLRNTIIIPKNTPIPCSKTESFCTHSHGQDRIKCEVTQGEDEDPEFVKLIHDGELKLPSDRPPGCEIRVTYSYNANQIMSCSFLDVESGKTEEFDLRLTDSPAKKEPAKISIDEAGFNDLEIV